VYETSSLGGASTCSPAPNIHGHATTLQGLHSASMKKLLILVALVALAAVAAKKVRTV
jgi:uncharacterized membrane protein